MTKKKVPFLNRELSWLYFNERVLQEATDETVPLIERIKFLSIFSSNLEEFYRVRVATMTRLSNLNDKAKELLGFNPKKVLNEIKNIVVKQERKFEQLFQATLINELAQNRIFILNDTQLNVARGEFVKEHFRDKILSNLVPIMIDMEKPFPELKDRYLYFFVRLKKKTGKKDEKYALIELPPDLPRFLVLPETNGLKFIILAEDIIKYCLDDIFYVFKYDEMDAYSMQLTRDAELDIDKNVSDKFIDELKTSLDKRKKGKPMRLLYDTEMPFDMLGVLVAKMKIEAESLIPGNRYHKFGDFIRFPNVGDKSLEYPANVPLKVFGLHRTQSIFNKLAERDYLVNLPYQSYDYIILFLREAAIDPKVTAINITLYRLAENSRVINALINAAKNGKKVNCLVELKARFDERANIFWTNRLEEEGVHVNYGLTDYKVHSKICLVTRIEKGRPVYYANLATGNFNEKTAKLYCDHSIFTAKKEITHDLIKLFAALNKRTVATGFKYLIVSPLESRTKFYTLIDREIKIAKSGKPAYLIFKVNSLADEGIVEKLYDASNAGVKIKLIVRGICCLVPGVKDFSENITVISIIDKFLEHARVFIFGNNGKEEMFLSSADLMSRNFEHRVEVGFPVLDEDVKQEIRDIIDFQLQDNVKARDITRLNNNKYHKNRLSTKVRAQVQTYNYLKNKHQ
ncbi:polyphosphate kinase [Pedobacter cryoconitis]|uniref:Polyphosphate kinase n=1 Tax=Pedobacter cryoconitis TaxID=188932 RepID=A0A7W8YNV1_9SPHI|nr:polyphosphate kinase 1 [Pedobacter cryoconitis]MBB5619037.1 polyphosphate kinase [Pedobacter cryoconitis]MBB5644334.1 polyphosphate kinase [Pedobacter cryoconitis]